MIIYMKKSYKKRSRKRSTKKRARRARRRTKKAGEYSKLAKDLLRSKTERKKKLAENSRPLREYFQKRPLNSADADLVDGIAVSLKRKRGQTEGMAQSRKAARKQHIRLSKRDVESSPQAIKMTNSFTPRKRKHQSAGKRKKRKTRRRRRRR